MSLNNELFMCCHKQYEVIPPMWRPIQCGAALNPTVDGAIRDNIGENISAQNREYCELTAHYYAWKNVEADHYGFCHYRRFFAAEKSTALPYHVLGELTQRDQHFFLKDSLYWKEVITSNDIIAPRCEDMGLSVREHYITSEHHYAEDLKLFFDILAEKAPQLNDSAMHYLGQNRQYFCNMFIMDKVHFFEYCEILFSVLEEFDKHKNIHGSFQSDRTDGYLGELFTGVYINYCRECGAKVKELPRLDVECSVKKRLVFALLPPESRRRFWVKKLVKKIRGKKNV